MRRTRLFPALALFMLLGCNQQLIDSTSVTGEGEVVISLSADERVDIVGVKSGTQEAVPDVDEFWIEIVNSENVKFKREKYSDIAGKKIGMNAGEFTLMAKHGDSLGVGFDKPFYMAKQKFTVEPQKTAEVKAVAKLANVKVAVDYGEQIRSDYSGFYTVVKHSVHPKTSLTFDADETRAGYMPGGQITVTVYAMIEGELKCYTLKDADGNIVYVDAEPNDFITFNVNTGINYGGLVITMKIDDETEQVEKIFEVPADAASNTRPSITLSSFDEDGNYYVTEGIQDAPADLGFTYKVYSGLKKCQLSIASDYLKGLGVPELMDLKGMTPEQQASLESLGFFFASDSNIGVIGMEDVIYAFSADARYLGGQTPTKMGTFTLDIEDEVGNTASETVNVHVKPDAKSVITINDYDIWATKVVNPVVRSEKGNVSLMKVQSSLDGQNWSDFMSVPSSDFSMGTIRDLAPSTSYYLRVLYDDWLVISDEVKVMTEPAQQISNSGFEDWTRQNWSYKQDLSGVSAGPNPIPWYQPWTTDQWWDTNATAALNTDLSSGYTYFKCFPVVGYSTTAHSGSKSALIMVVNVGNTNSTWWTNGEWFIGEMFLGRGNDDTDNFANGWKHVTDGHAFQSRPSSMTFWYKYEVNNSSEKFGVEMSVLASDGTVLATGSATGSPVSNWSQMKLDFNYNVTDKKAAKIYMSFKASVTSDHSCSSSGHFAEVSGSHVTSGDPYRIKLGAALRIDDIVLNY